jgi:hypothetical protein
MPEIRQLTEKHIEQANELKQLFLEKYNFDILDQSRDGLFPAYRSLFNNILTIKFKLNKSSIAFYYISQGWDKKNHNTIANSLYRFDRYKTKYKEIDSIFYEFFPYLLKEKEYEKLLKYKFENQNALQKAVSDIPKDRQLELLEMINLRKNSWNWKSKDTVKVYVAT